MMLVLKRVICFDCSNPRSGFANAFGIVGRLQPSGESLSMPQSRPMPNIGKGCHELRINDESKTWRIIYRIDDDAIVVVDVFAKKTNKTPDAVIKRCQKRLKQYDAISEKVEDGYGR